MIVKESMTSDNLLIENFNDYGEENQSEEERENQVPLEVSQEERKELINKNKSKLEKLLCQPDIFECLRRINSGQIRSFDELNLLNQGISKGRGQIQSDTQSRRRIHLNKNDEMEELNNDEDEQLFEIQKIEKQPENIVGGTLRDYQLEGLNWLYKLHQANLNGILADEMGLGKTIQSISIIALVESLKTEEERLQRHSHHIVIVPKIVLGKWKKEISDWVPSLRLFQFYGSNEEREQQKMELRQHKFDVMLTTFETVIREKQELTKLEFEFLILDEAQRIKNDQSVLSQVLRKFKTRHRLLLTGTPLQNNLKELWSLLNFLMPRLFDSSEEFKELFMIKSDDENSQELIIKQIHRLLRPFMLRRLKMDVEKHLPSKKEIYLFIGLSKLQKQLYKNILTGNIDVVNGIGDKIKLLNVLMQLKKVCNHPYLFDKVEPGPPFVDGEHLVENSMKFKVLDLLIPKLLQQGCKILIFSQMTRLLNILDDFLRFRGYRYCRIDGQTSAMDREMRIEDFQKDDSDKQLFILSTRAGGLGINLHSANVVIIFDSDWNPQVDLQAIDRAHRIGQKRDVVVYRFVTEGSVEEKIVERAARKLKVDHLIMQKGKFNLQHNQDNNPSRINAQEMLLMIKYGAQEIILTEQEGQAMEENIDSIIEYSMKKTEEINQVLNKIEDKFNLNNVSLTGEDEKHSNLYTFEGQDYKKRTAVSTEADFIDIGQRERKQLSYDIDKYYREALNIPTQTKEKKKLKGWRAQVGGGYDHQFFNNEKLDALEEKETNWQLYQQNPEEYLKNSETKQKPPQFSAKDQKLKETLLKEGFPNWSKKEFFTFIRMCEMFGRSNYAKINEALPNKTVKDIEEYSEFFWNNWRDRIENGHKYVERIEKGEAEIEKQRSIDDAIESKFTYAFKDFLSSHPGLQLSSFQLNDLTIPKRENLAKKVQGPFDFSEEEDKFIALALYKYGYGSWEMIRNEIRNSNLFRFNWIAKTWTIQDIQKRCEQIVSKLKKEVQLLRKLEEEEKGEQDKGKKRKGTKKSLGTKNNKGKAIRRSLKKRKRSEDSEEDSNYEVDPEAIKVEEKFIKMQFHSNETSMQSSQKNSKLNGTRNGSSSLRNNRRVEKLKEKRQNGDIKENTKQNSTQICSNTNSSQQSAVQLSTTRRSLRRHQ